jgi:lipoyl(octanoyl) transferase
MQPYSPVWHAMQRFTDARDPASTDEIWTLQHAPIFTLGQAGKPEHLIDPGDIPVLRCDRGGQVTYHGPGQIIAYVLYDLRRGGTGIKRLVQDLEAAAIELLAGYGIEAQTRLGAPGVYVGAGKIAALGLRVRRGASYHGLSLNVDMDLEPFSRINPCGYPGLRVTCMSQCAAIGQMQAVERRLVECIASRLGVCVTPGEAMPIA